MTKTEKLLLLLTAVFLAALLLLAPKDSAVRRVEDRNTVTAAEKLPQTGDAVLVLQKTVDLNTATVEELCSLPGIGEATARAILDYRESEGPFSSPEELLNVPGIGTGTVEGILRSAGRLP